MKRIDFAASHLAWLTKKERSYGRFQIEAVCTVLADLQGAEETFCLAAAVVAGNVYAEKDLIKIPPYLFQIVASKDRHVIFRTSIPQLGHHGSVGANGELFAEMSLCLKEREAVVLDDFDYIEAAVRKGAALSARICREKSSVGKIDIEFPIKHINIRKETRLFQVETGPIAVISERSEADVPSLGLGLVFQTAFVHFNRLDRAELAIHAPVKVGREVVYAFTEIQKIEADIQIMADMDCK
ncbi:MAG: hypothetical protein QM278_01470 [Pseudomonadota bacterium]|nr:hypothetical protein [Pseudomonadota bacterium]